MGISNKLLQADVGICSNCNTKYVVKARIACDDSHSTSHDRYACPNCKGEFPKEVIEDVRGKDYAFAREQLRVELDVNCREKSKLNLIISELD